MNKYLSKLITSVIGTLIILGACWVTKSTAPLWVFIILPALVKIV